MSRQIRRSLPCLLMLIVGVTGCAENISSTPVSTPQAADVTVRSSPLAGSGAALLQQCMGALGGEAARSALQSGQIRLSMTMDSAIMDRFKDMPPMAATLEVTYEGPVRERRHVRSHDGEHNALYIKNESGLWIRTQDGAVTIMPPVPPLSDRGPGIVGLVQAFFEYNDQLSHAEIGDASPELPEADVLDLYNGDVLAAHLYLDRMTHLPMRFEQTTVAGIPGAKEFGIRPTTTDYSDYQTFGPVTMPTRVIGRQEGKVVMNVTLSSADFNTTPAASLFEFPDDPNAVDYRR